MVRLSTWMVIGQDWSFSGVNVNYNDPDAPEHHLVSNVNLTHAKLSKYYKKFDHATVYYAAYDWYWD
jgi:hypothetical protein